MPYDKNRTVGLFGGAFDPIHIGHFVVAQQVVSKGLVDEVWFMPCYSDAFGKKVNMSSPEHRAEMIRLLIGERNASGWAMLCTYELMKKNEAGTYSVMKSLQKDCPEIDFKFIMGTDQACKIKMWRNSRKFLREMSLIVVNRRGYPSAPGWVRWGKYRDNYSLITVPETELPSTVSSTVIRQNCRVHGTASGGVTPSVSNYITQNKLYAKVDDAVFP